MPSDSATRVSISMVVSKQTSTSNFLVELCGFLEELRGRRFEFIVNKDRETDALHHMLPLRRKLQDIIIEVVNRPNADCERELLILSTDQEQEFTTQFDDLTIAWEPQAPGRHINVAMNRILLEEGSTLCDQIARFVIRKAYPEYLEASYIMCGPYTPRVTPPRFPTKNAPWKHIIRRRELSFIRQRQSPPVRYPEYLCWRNYWRPQVMDAILVPYPVFSHLAAESGLELENLGSEELPVWRIAFPMVGSLLDVQNSCERMQRDFYARVERYLCDIGESQPDQATKRKQ